jgi:hypothetical protein
MPEGTPDAAILIAISWQALNRAIRGSAKTRIADCTVLILFAGFFIEANVNYIVDQMNKTNEMRNFIGTPYPGLQDKLAWYYNIFVARKKASTRNQMYQMGIKAKLRRKFPGFATIYKFRNEISHGRVNRTANSVSDAKHLRIQCKAIVDDLFDIAARVGYSIKRVTTYDEALAIAMRN